MMMKVSAIHNAVGQILEIIVSPEEGPTVGIRPRVGQTITQVDIPHHIQLIMSNENVQELAQLIQKYKVVVEPKIGKLERNAESA
jgi:hypothetical protein